MNRRDFLALFQDYATAAISTLDQDAPVQTVIAVMIADEDLQIDFTRLQEQ